MKAKQYGILGLGHFGESLALHLTKNGADVIVIDKDEDKIQNIANYVAYAVQADVADLNALRSVGLKNVDAAVISLTTDINASLMAVLNCQELGIPEIYSKVNNEQHKRVLEHLGVNRIFNPEDEMGTQIAKELIAGSFFHELQLSDDYSIVEVYPLKSWYSKTLMELDLRARYGITVIAIVYGDDNTNIAPRATDIIEPGSKLVVLGANTAINNINRMATQGK